MSIITRTRLTGNLRLVETRWLRRLIVEVEVITERAMLMRLYAWPAPPGHPDPEGYQDRQRKRINGAWKEVSRSWRPAAVSDLSELPQPQEKPHDL